MSSTEYWDTRVAEAEIAKEVAENRRANIQRTGQLALFGEAQPDNYAIRHGEVKE